MIRIIYLLLISASFSSSLELYGTGERYDFISASGLGMGGAYHFSDDSDNINPTSIATYWKSNLTRISLSAMFFSNITGYNDKNINLSSFLFSFPLHKNKNLTFGLTPYTRADIEIHETSGYTIGEGSSEFNPVLNSLNDYYVYGGISNLFTAFSMRLNKSNSFGIQINNLFGNQLHLNKITISELDPSFDLDDSLDYTYDEYDSTHQVIFNNFSGYSIKLDWILEIKRHQFAFSATSMGPIDIKHKIYYNLYAIADPIERFIYNNYNFLSIESGSDILQYEPYYSIDINDDIDFNSFFKKIFSRINDFSIGYHYNLFNKGFILEYHSKDLFKNESLKNDGISIFNHNQPSTCSYHIGAYQKYLNSKLNSWNSITVRLGAYYKQILSDNILEEDDFRDIALTFGVGIKLNNNKNLVDLGLKFGKMDHYLFQNEYYAKGILTIDIGERWFERFRRDR